jgi:hypothetical protein
MDFYMRPVSTYLCTLSNRLICYDYLVAKSYWKPIHGWVLAKTVSRCEAAEAVFVLALS